MDLINGMIGGFAVALQPVNLFAALAGALVGTATGVLPGLGVLGAMAILMPITIHFSAVTGLIMLAGIYYGAMYGGSTTAILLKIPGEGGSIVTTIDGYEFARKGRAGAALMICAVGSFIAGTISILGLSLFTPILADAALKFSSPEFCMLALLGALTLIRITGRDPMRNMLMLLIGAALATIGVDAVSGDTRFTLGTESLALGFDLVPLTLGLYGLSELLQVLTSTQGFPRAETVRLRDMVPTRAEWSRAWPAIVRGSGIGFLIGLLPGPGSLTSTFASYGIERAIARTHRDEFGKGAVEGFAGPEAANNAVATSALVPVLSLGIPFTPNVALMLGALIVQGIQPGPLLLAQHPDVVWGLLASMYIGNIALLALNLPLVGIWVRLLRVPQYALIGGIFVISFVGVYTMRGSYWDLCVLLASGIVGFVLRRMEFDMAPLVLGLVMGPIFEKALRETLFLSGGEFSIFVTRPISAVLVALCGVAILAPSLLNSIKRRRIARAELIVS
ncbi:putative tricarboxylic transport membrane protein [Nitrobacteraceae bacterium AZCC 1564]